MKETPEDFLKGAPDVLGCGFAVLWFLSSGLGAGVSGCVGK